MPQIDEFVEQLREGIRVEMEHQDVTGGNLVETTKIALAHLQESSDYYRKLKVMEDQIKQEKNSDLSITKAGPSSAPAKSGAAPSTGVKTGGSKSGGPGAPPRDAEGNPMVWHEETSRWRRKEEMMPTSLQTPAETRQGIVAGKYGLKPVLPQDSNATVNRDGANIPIAIETTKYPYVEAMKFLTDEEKKLAYDFATKKSKYIGNYRDFIDSHHEMAFNTKTGGMVDLGEGLTISKPLLGRNIPEYKRREKKVASQAAAPQEDNNMGKSEKMENGKSNPANPEADPNYIQKPMGPYEDFADCVAHNKDKGDPKAYCATIMRAVEGKESVKKSNKLNEFKDYVEKAAKCDEMWTGEEKEKPIEKADEAMGKVKELKSKTEHSDWMSPVATHAEKLAGHLARMKEVAGGSQVKESMTKPELKIKYPKNMPSTLSTEGQGKVVARVFKEDDSEKYHWSPTSPQEKIRQARQLSIERLKAKRAKPDNMASATEMTKTDKLNEFKKYMSKADGTPGHIGSPRREGKPPAPPKEGEEDTFDTSHVIGSHFHPVDLPPKNINKPSQDDAPWIVHSDNENSVVKKGSATDAFLRSIRENKSLSKTAKCDEVYTGELRERELHKDQSEISDESINRMADWMERDRAATKASVDTKTAAIKERKASTNPATPKIATAKKD